MKLHQRNRRNLPKLGGFDNFRRLGVASKKPDEDIRVKDHGTALCAGFSLGLRR